MGNLPQHLGQNCDFYRVEHLLKSKHSILETLWSWPLCWWRLLIAGYRKVCFLLRLFFFCFIIIHSYYINIIFITMKSHHITKHFLQRPCFKGAPKGKAWWRYWTYFRTWKRELDENYCVIVWMINLASSVIG